MQLHGYRYYDPKTCGFDFTGALEDISVSVTFRARVQETNLLVEMWCFTAGSRYLSNNTGNELISRSQIIFVSDQNSDSVAFQVSYLLSELHSHLLVVSLENATAKCSSPACLCPQSYGSGPPPWAVEGDSNSGEGKENELTSHSSVFSNWAKS